MKNTLLLVDDEKYILKTLQRLLGEEGYTIFTATSGQEALELLKNHAIQVVISDQRMPQMKGNDLLKQVKKLYPDTVRMVLSAYVDFGSIQEAINEGAIYKFISKPWQDDVLLNYVHEAFALYNKNKEMKPIAAPINRDVLTGLQNRFSFYDILSQFLSTDHQKSNPLAIFYFDIDRFSNINTRLGLKNGDLILQQLAERLKKFIKKEEHIARLGNDEFALILTEKKKMSNLSSYINELLSLIKTPLVIDAQKIYLTVSMGVGTYPEHGDSIDLLMNHISKALLHCKSLGGDQYHMYNTSMDKVDQIQLILENDLHQALAKKQFLIYYQPIYTIDKQVASVEALIRWQHPIYGLLPPEKFIPLSEETNFIVPLGEWIMRTACQQMKQWYGLGYVDLRVAVNLSPRQINAKLIDLVLNILETAQLPPNCLELEITETIIIQDMEVIIPLLKSLRGLGVHLSLDDFGTGYSSLSYLRLFPFTSLKIDRSFINEMVKSKHGESIFEAIIALGKNLELKLIAEGVETSEQLVLLKGKQCDFIQGSLYSKPVPEQKIIKLLR